MTTTDLHLHRRDHPPPGRQQRRRRTTALFSVACAVALSVRQYAPRPGPGLRRGVDVDVDAFDRGPGGGDGVAVAAAISGSGGGRIEVGDAHRRTQLWPSTVAADEDGDGDGDDDGDDAEVDGGRRPPPTHAMIASSYGYIPRPQPYGTVGNDDEYAPMDRRPRVVVEVDVADIVDRSDFDAGANSDAVAVDVDVDVDVDVAHADAEVDEEDAGVLTHARLIDGGMSLPHYSVVDAVRTSRMYDNTFALLVYDPERDVFYLLYSRRHTWIHAGNKLLTSFRTLTYFMRRAFPQRFQGKTSDELVIPISSGDYPSVKVECLDFFREHRGSEWASKKSKATCGDGNPAPILHFGSVFRQPRMFPNMIAMPMPVPEHLDCLEKWVVHGEVCPRLRARSASDVDGEFVYGDQVGLAWEDLIPQVVWRGTDFSFLTRVYPTLRRPVFNKGLIEWPWQEQEEDDQRTNKIFGRMTALKAAIVERRLDRVRKRAPRRADQNKGRLLQFNKAAAVKALREQYDVLVPRWKAVVLTGEAEIDSAAAHALTQPDGDMTLPWANMKFSTFVGDGGHKTHSEGSNSYKDWEKIGFPATGEYMSLLDLAHYKYQIDLGGGGGTTWSGTIQKLALPGLLFHHMTPTKDYIHDYMRPWVHFIPVSSDLHDLKRKYDWAESNPVESKKIAEAGTNLARYLTSREGLEDIFNRDVAEPLRRIIEAYQPISIVHPHGRASWRNWREAIRQIEDYDDVLVPIYECESWTPRACQPLQGRNWWQTTFSVYNRRKRFG